jgi:hypothetical protein
MEFFFKDGAKTRFLEEIADAFRFICPTEYKDFLRHVKEQNKALIRTSGMSAEGHFMNRMYIPGKMYSFIKQQARKRLGIDEFFNDRKNYDLLSRVWTECETKRQRSVFYDAVAEAQKRAKKEKEWQQNNPKASVSPSSPKTASENSSSA